MMLCCLSMGAHAEGGCPPGTYPIGNRAVAACAPIPDGAGGRQGQQQVPIPPAPVWEDRWGAMAVDGPHGVLGTSTGLSRESSAQQVALENCRAKGGIDCKLQLSYRNACGAFTVNGDGAYSSASSATLDQAISLSMQECTKGGAKNCSSYFSACSPPVRVR